MVEFEIFLSIDEAPVSFLSIPLSDIERLAIFPFRWIRYVMFAICGAHGDLSTQPDGPPVDYDRTEFVDGENTYYYRPSEDCAFVDPEGLTDQLTSTEQTLRRQNFRGDVIQRDGPACVVTQEGEGLCDAIHLIPRNKGEEYIARVIQLRSPRDDSVPPSPPSNAGIDDIINGILVSKNLHAMQGIGEVAFIKTPNYGLRPEDIKKVQRGDSRPDYITLQWLKKPKNYNPTILASLQTLHTGDVDFSPELYSRGASVDALFQGDGVPLPSTVILDYVYGVAAYKSWRSNRGVASNVMNEYREAHYAQIPPFPRSLPDDTEDDTSGPDDPNDLEYTPVPQNRCKATRRDESELARAMDELNMVLMYVTRGITPEEAAERRQKKIEQEERAAQEASRSKVMEWRKHHSS